MNNFSISVVIPTYNRGKVLIETLNYLAQQKIKPAEIIVVDQTTYADNDDVKLALQSRNSQNIIQWRRLPKPSIPAAMNHGLLKATSDYVLFLDDDVSFECDFISHHLTALEQYQPIAHVGQIIQPWQTVEELGSYQRKAGLYRDLDFPFNCDQVTDIYNCMAGNLCVNRAIAIQIGGFDEQFTGAAYRFETEFCRRMTGASSQAFKFIPSASLNHLHHNSGGTRNKIASHLTSSSSDHSVGDYYFSKLSDENKVSIIMYGFQRLISSLVSSFYLQKPWWIPVRILAEVKGWCRSRKLIKSGQKLIKLT